MTRRLEKNGQALHRAMQAGDEAEQALRDERRLLKEEKEKRAAKALEPKPKAVDRLLRTHHAQPKEKPASAKDAHGKEASKPKARRTRAEKHAEKAAAMEAARNSHKKAAAKPAK
ncbi:hypothetical protein LZ009_05460 [Ramlibacter sp. XY19]|uniref:hypothetical protein n=1 Tax=Ramlibacter paludis TaxID=2908000 RepID=UPI0023D9A87B|nr:hypothetical protein [Ramlibacter paludis]MCG2592224.1 hypothetical protein [Ramlibacter paludis]